MLQPKEADLPFLFLIFVVFPLLAYYLLGKWSDAAKRRERINLLAQLAAEEFLTPEPMPASPPNAPVTLLPTSKNGLHVCARCFGPATTRCSRCKSVRYCSGKCQILHWRQVHKLECQRLETTTPCSPRAATTEDSIPDRVARVNPLNSICRGCNNVPSVKPGHHSVSTGGFATVPNCSPLDTSQDALLQRQSGDKRASCKSNREISRKQDVGVIDSSEETYRSRTTNSIFYNNISNDYPNAHDTASAEHETQKYSGCGDIFVSRSGHGSSSSLHQGRNGENAHENGTDCVFASENLPNMQNTAEIVDSKCSYESAVMQGSGKAGSASHPLGTKNAKPSRSMMKVSREQLPSEMERESIGDGSKPARIRFPISASGSSGAASFGIMKMMGLKNPTKPSRQDATQLGGVHRKTKMLFPYEEFVKIFTYQVVELSPRGLLNCGNSCYANAVLQCLTCTRPLMIFLLHRSHSRACRGKDWCLMCELEQHVTMLRDCGGPLSSSSILLHVRNTNCQIGDGSQEDAHEFLRLLVGSMQSICLEGLGGEDKVDPTLQETTFIQHTFGGRLRSKVKCLRCHHESERYENIMDLSLEIFGWVESLEDALTQFTITEELDGENKYRCGRCATYVRARKQLSIDVAPNILTIVLKRFQEGKYGKLNKYITFPEMLDMVPFMTGMSDIPPLYVLYAVVVHLDTLNASFSGHYVAYVKDMQGSWFRVDDTEVHPVPMSQVMSEGAYILFYMRSCPRPQRLCHDKASRQEVPASSGQFTSRTQKPSRQGQSKSSRHFVGPERLWDVKTENVAARTGHDNGILWEARNGNISQMTEFSDATSSDWSLFTSSDEASFTTESTRDSFSVFDYSDVNNAEKLSPLCKLYAPEFSRQSTLCSRRFSSSRPQSRYISEERGYVLDSYLSTKPPEEVGKFKGILDCSNGSQTDRYCAMPVNYKSNLNYGLDRTSSHCKL